MADNTQKKIILSVGADTSQAAQAVDQLQGKLDGVSNTTLDKPFRGFKTEIKEATLEAARMEAQFGKNSVQFADAAKRVADLKDRFGEFNNSIQAFSPDNKLQSFVSIGGAAIKTVQGLTAGMNLLGLQSGSAEQAIQKLQAIMAFSDVLNSIDDIKNGFSDMLNVAKNAFKSLSKGDLIGIAIIGITALGVAIYDAVVNTRTLTEEQERYNQVTNIALDRNGKQIASLEILISRIKQGGLTQAEKTRTLDEYNSSLGDTLGKYKTYQELEKALISNGPKYIQYLLAKAQAEAAYGLLLEEQQKVLRAQQKDARDYRSFSVLGIFFDDENTDKQSKDAAINKLQGQVDKISNMYTQLQENADKLKSSLNIPETTVSTGSTKTTSNKVAGETNSELIKGLSSQNIKTFPELDLREQREKEFNDRMLGFKEAYNSETAKLNDEWLSNSFSVLQANIALEENAEKTKSEIAKREYETKKYLIGQSLGIMDAAAEIVGRQTVAGKALAVASSTINTYQAATEALKANYGVFGPAAQIARIVTVASVIATGLKNVKAIVSTQIPKVSGVSGGGSFSVPSITNTAPVINASSIQQPNIQDVRVTNQNQTPVRAYILNSDLQNNEQKNRFLNSISTF